MPSATVIIYQAECKYTVKIYLQYEQINFYKGRVILRKVNRVTNIILFILTGLQCSESIWFHGEHYISLEGKTNFFEKRVAEYQKSGVMSRKSSTSWEHDCIQNRWKFLNLFRVHHENGERLFFGKKNLPEIWTESPAVIEVVYISMLLSTLHK